MVITSVNKNRFTFFPYIYILFIFIALLCYMFALIYYKVNSGVENRNPCFIPDLR